MSRGKRAVVRPSPCLFEGPLEFVSFRTEKGATRYGHLVSSDTCAGTSVIFPEMAAATVVVATDAIKTLTRAEALPAIPPSVFCGDAAAKRQHTGSSIDFISFCIPAGAPAVLFVRPCGDTRIEWTTDVLLDTITRVVGPAFGTPIVAETAAMDGWLPCSHFTDGGDATGGVPPIIALLNLTPLGVEQCTRAAHGLAATGLVISAPFSVHGSSGPAPFARVTSSVLKWIKDSDVMTDLSAIVDQLPGLLHGNTKRDSVLGNAAVSLDAEPSTMSGVIYDAGFNVQRLMICWGMLAASLSRNMDDISDVPEPLCSYIRLIRGFECMRDSRGSDAVDAADLTKLLTYNVAPKLTAAQACNALTLFYWAAVHEDDATRALPKDVARRALEMYVPFGHVILRKRAYRFNS